MQRAELERELETLHPASWAWALGCCRRNRDDADDVLQSVYVMVLDGRAKFDERSAFKTWLFGVIRRTALASYRRRAVRNALLLRFLDRTQHSDPPSSEPHLVRSLARLPRRQREVIELVFYHDLTVDGAAAIMGVSAGSARVHYDRAKKRLRVLLEGRT
ncbi:MAG TPA: sigma-70 family RNA polymerase sigma factor [Thermoanaerobaculia bacterium]|nr:sigma-70 family RNA polymerase sigma factor [Thermoanaerobaculia bacterium]